MKNEVKVTEGLYVACIIGTQHLYGADIFTSLKQNGSEIAASLTRGLHYRNIPVSVSFVSKIMNKCFLGTTEEEVAAIVSEIMADKKCIGTVIFSHTFSPGHKWIHNFKGFAKPIVILHTSMLKKIDFQTLDMSVMNLHQGAHGNPELFAALIKAGMNPAIIVGDYESDEVRKKFSDWVRAALGCYALRYMCNVLRFGDNMRSVGNTDGNKFLFKQQFGASVDGYGVSVIEKTATELLDGERVTAVIDSLCEQHDVAPELKPGGKENWALREDVAVYLAIRDFLIINNYGGFTTTFEDLILGRLPGLAAQLLMFEGFGFGAEGDWKGAAFCRALKIMSIGLEGGTSFNEPYLLDNSTNVLFSHMLEICPTLCSANEKLTLEIADMNIGGGKPPCRLVGKAAIGSAINFYPVDCFSRFRFVASEAEIISSRNTPNLRLITMLMRTGLRFEEAEECLMQAAVTHHPITTQSLNMAILEMFVEMIGSEFLIIDAETTPRAFKDQIKRNALEIAIRNIGQNLF